MALSRMEFIVGGVMKVHEVTNPISLAIKLWTNLYPNSEISQSGPEQNIIQSGIDTIEMEGKRYRFNFEPSASLVLIQDIAQRMGGSEMSQKVTNHLNRHELELVVTNELEAMEEGKFIPPKSFDDTRKTRSKILLRPRTIEGVWRVKYAREKADFLGTDKQHAETLPHEFVHFAEYSSDSSKWFARNDAVNLLSAAFVISTVTGGVGGRCIATKIDKSFQSEVVGTALGFVLTGIPSGCALLNTPNAHSHPIFNTLPSIVENNTVFLNSVLSCVNFQEVTLIP